MAAAASDSADNLAAREPAGGAFPGPVSRPMLEELARYVVAEPFPFVLDLERCQGSWLATVDGQRLFDWAGYYASKLIAHNHPRLAEPDYVRRLLVAANNKVCNPDMLTAGCLDYYRLLHQFAPACMTRGDEAAALHDRHGPLEVYAVNSGAEAVENMLKYLINLHHHKQLAAGRPTGPQRFIYFGQAFHGRTVFTLNVTQIDSAPVITRHYHGLFAGNIQVDFPALDADAPAEANRRRVADSLAQIGQVLERFGEQIVGIIVEPIQGAGGHRVAAAEFWPALSELAHRAGVYLGFDEVQTAGGPTGAFFTADQLDLPHPPQAIAAGKKLANGVVYMLYPMPDRGVLDSTWGGTLADMVRFVQEMAIVRDERLIEQVPAKERRLVEGLRALQSAHPAALCNIRGMGLYQGFSLRRPGLLDRLLDCALRDESLLLLGAAGQTVRLRPTLSVTEDEIALLLEKLDRCLARLGEAEK